MTESTISSALLPIASKSNEYQYTALNNSKATIRLFAIDRENMDILSCTLETYELATSLPYIALSYTWRPSRTHPGDLRQWKQSGHPPKSLGCLKCYQDPRGARRSPRPAELVLGGRHLHQSRKHFGEKSSSLYDGCRVLFGVLHDSLDRRRDPSK